MNILYFLSELPTFAFGIFLMIYALRKFYKKDTFINGFLILDIFITSLILSMFIDSFPLEFYEWGFISQKYIITLIMANLYLGVRANWKELLSRLNFDITKYYRNRRKIRKRNGKN